MTQFLKLLQTVSEQLLSKKLLKPNQLLLVTISGGQDSVCLFLILLHLKNQWKWNIHTLYCNHLWQKDSVFIAKQLGKFTHLFQTPLYLTITPSNITSEKKARDWRYNIFYRLSNFLISSPFIYFNTAKKIELNMILTKPNILDSFQTKNKINQVGFRKNHKKQIKGFLWVFKFYLHISKTKSFLLKTHKSKIFPIKDKQFKNNFKYFDSSQISLITGHTANDKVETLFFNIIRGCGLRGVYSLKWKRLLEDKKYKKIFLPEFMLFRSFGCVQAEFKKERFSTKNSQKKDFSKTSFFKRFLSEKKNSLKHKAFLLKTQSHSFFISNFQAKIDDLPTIFL